MSRITKPDTNLTNLRHTDENSYKTLQSPVELVYQDCVVKSGIRPDITALNFFPISGIALYDHLYRDSDPTTNTSGGSSQAKRNYAKCESAYGWICNSRVRQLGGEPLALDKKGKPRRYHQPQGKPLTVFFPKVTLEVWGKVAAKNNMPLPKFPVVGIGEEAIGFWDWVIESGCRVIVTEGEKKAAALISRGYAAIGLPGIHTGYRVTERGETVKKIDGTEYQRAVARKLHDALQSLDTADREVIVLFDYRVGNYAQSPEFKAASTLGKLFKNAIAQIAVLPGPAKGVDDFLVAGGDVDKIITEACLKPAIEWQCEKWARLRGFSSTTKINLKYFHVPAPTAGKILVIKSGLGTGKTEYIKLNIASDPRGIQINIGYRNSLLLQQSEKWGFYHLDEHDGYKMIDDPDARLSLCIDSLLKLPLEMFIGATIIIDEAVSVIKHMLLSRTLKDKRLEVLERFAECCQVADRIILSDGNMSDTVVDYIKAISGKTADCVENEYQGDTPPIFFIDGGKKAKEWLSKEISVCSCPAIATDSLRDAEALAVRLTKERGEGILLTSKTATKQWAKDFLKDPDAYIAASKPNWLIYTPTAESGIDISIRDYFSDVFCWFVGVIGVDESVQMSRRVRHPQRITILSPERGLASRQNAGLFEQDIIKAFFDAGHIEARLLLTDDALFQKYLDDYRAQLETPHTKLLAQLLVKAELERQRLRVFLLSAFEGSGYTVQFVTAGECDDRFHAEAKQLTKDKEAQEIFDAPDIEVSEALNIKRDFKADWEQRCKATKCLLRSQLPGIENSDLWNWEFVRRVRFDETNLLNQLAASWALENPEDADYLASTKLKAGKRVFLGDFDSRWLRGRLLASLNIKQFLEPGKVWTNNSPEVLAIVKTCSKKAIAAELGHPGKTPGIRFINKLLGMIGVQLISKAIKRDGKTVREYSYDPEKSRPENWDRLAIFVSQRQLKKIADAKEAEMLAAMVFDLVADDPENDTNIGVSATSPEVEPVAQIVSPEPVVEQALVTQKTWAWFQRKLGEWIKCRVLGFTGECYRLEIESMVDAGTAIIKAYPEDLRWEAPAT